MLKGPIRLRAYYVENDKQGRCKLWLGSYIVQQPEIDTAGVLIYLKC